MVPDLLWLAIGLGCIVKGGGLFVSSSIRLASLLRMPHAVIGSTLVSLATTTPEMTVSILAGCRGEPGLAVGNAVGSCLCNLGLILGCVAALREVPVRTAALRTAFVTMLAAGCLLFVMTLDLELDGTQGGVLVALGLAYFGYDFWRHLREGRATEQAALEVETEWVTRHRWLRSGWGTAALFAAGAALVVVGSWVLVGAAVHIASRLGIPSLIVGLTVVAVGTSLPEFVTALTSSRRQVSDLALGNLLGANVANLTLIVGSAAAIQSVSLSRGSQQFNFPWLLLVVLALLPCIRRGRLIRRDGWLLLGLYALYLAGVALLALTGRA